MKKFSVVLLLFILNLELFGKYCYSIETIVDETTPVNPFYLESKYTPQACQMTQDYLFKSNLAYLGCFNSKQQAQHFLNTSQFPFKQPKIIYHKQNKEKPYIIIPKKATLPLQQMYATLHTLKEKYTPKNLEKSLPTHFYGNGIDIVQAKSISFLPFINIYTLHMDYKQLGYPEKILILYDGIYSIETLYKKLHNNNYIEKKDDNTYEIKIPIVLSSTATLVINNKTILLQSHPKSVFIFYYGKFYIFNSTILAWDSEKNTYLKRSNIHHSKALYFNYEPRRAYITGLAGSKTYFVNNIFKGLGFHSISATFGLSVLYFPSIEKYFSPVKAFNYFLAKHNYPSGYYVGNDIYNGSMAFYTNKAKDIYYLGNYTHDNHIYNFDPHDYSLNLVIAYNLSTKAQLAHGIIISRGVDKSIIANNISINNHSAGIMVDRTSNQTLIANNFALNNGYMGISIQESNDILIKNNTIMLNRINGIMSRNSLNVTIANNSITNNGKNGIEIISKNIDKTVGRNFARDPYPKASAAIVKANTLQNNYASSIVVKNSAAIALENNTINDIKKYEGDLNFFSPIIEQNNGKFLLYGRGYPFHRISSDKIRLNASTLLKANNIYMQLAKEGDVDALCELGILYLKANKINKAKKLFYQAANKFATGALGYLGYIYLSQAKQQGYPKAKTLEGLTLIIEDMLLENPTAHDIKKVIYFVPNGKSLFFQAYKIAKQRFENGKLFAQQHIPLDKLQQQKLRFLINVFEYKKNKANTSLYGYISLLYNKFSIFSPNYLFTIQERIDKHNDIQDDVQLYTTQQQKYLRLNKECQRKMEQNRYFKQQTDTLIDDIKQQQIRQILPQLQKALDDINHFRVRKISMQQLLRSFSKGDINAP